MKKINVMDSNLKNKKEIPISLFSFLISEMINYTKNKEIKDLEHEMNCFGYPIGEKILELSSFREMDFKRETKVVNILLFISKKLWKYLFNKEADSVERSNENINEYRIIEANPITNKFIPCDSEKKKENEFNASNFIAGIIEGFLCSGGFLCKVGSQYVKEVRKNYYIITFDEEVIKKDQKEK